MKGIFAVTTQFVHWLRVAIAVAVVLTLLPIALAASAAIVRADQALSDFETSIDTAGLFNANQRGDAFALRVAADRVLVLEHEREIVGAGGARTWVGRLREGGSDNVVYITEANGYVYATIPASDSVFEIVGLAGKSATVRDFAARGMRRKLNFGKDYVVPPVLGARVSAAEQSADRQKALPTPQVTIDLMIVYTDAFATRYGANVATRINNLIAQANDSYVRSDVAITLRLVRAEQTSYANNTVNTDALQAIASGAGVFSTVAASRNTYAADLVALLRPLDDATHGGCGIAFVGGFNQTTLESQFGYAVVSEGSDLGGSGYLCLDKSLQHELGHNMGLMHDRATAASEGGNTGATSYAFGYIIPGTNPSVGDIMSYADNGVNCFSSPAVFRQGPIAALSGGACNVTPTTGDALGVAASNGASSADAAATLNFTRVAVSKFRVAANATLSGTISNGTPLANVTFCARPASGVTCTASDSLGAYSCTVPNGWTGVLHAAGPAGLRIKPQLFTNITANLSGQNPVVQAIGACHLDVDNNGLIEPATDGVAILRRMLGVSSSGFAGLSGTCAANTTSAAIFNATAGNYNATGGATTRPSTDGLVIVRAMQGLTGAAVTNGLGLMGETGATNTTWASIRNNFLNTTCGADFLP